MSSYLNIDHVSITFATDKGATCQRDNRHPFLQEPTHLLRDCAAPSTDPIGAIPPALSEPCRPIRAAPVRKRPHLRQQMRFNHPDEAGATDGGRTAGRVSAAVP